MSVDEPIQEFEVTREQVESVLQFAAHSTEVPVARHGSVLARAGEV